MKKRFKKFLLLLLVFVVLILLIQWETEGGNYYVVNYDKKDIGKILDGGITEDEYKTLREQTGLGRSAVNEILKEENYLETFEEFQKQNFSKNDVVCEYMFFPTTKGESLVDKNGKDIRLKLPELKTGDILVSKSTHTFMFRHGHAGLVIDSETSEVLEAMMIGTNSAYTNVSSWRNYPTLAVLRPKNLTDEQIEYVVEFAKSKLHDVKYDLTAGLLGDSFDADKTVTKTHCSHLVWYAYMSAGINIGSSGGFVVLPEDFLKSDELEVVWSYGINVTK